MKTFKTVIIAFIGMIALQTTNAQCDKTQRLIGEATAHIKVYGNCGMDKSRIEKNARIVAGVSSAVWNEDTQILTLKYAVAKVNLPDDVQKKIAAAGNDTEKYRADDKVYESLPDCCHYPGKNHS